MSRRPDARMTQQKIEEKWNEKLLLPLLSSYAQSNVIVHLMVLVLVVFQGKPLLLPKHHSVSLETRKQELVKTNISVTGEVHMQASLVIKSMHVSPCCSVTEGVKGIS